MQYEVIQINASTWRIEDQGVRFFLLTGSEHALLIDSGMNVHNARDIALELTTLPLSLLNTHADRDHTGSNAQFSEFYMNPAEEDNLKMHGNSGKIVPVGNGTLLDLGGRPLEIIELPGHTPGSIAVLDKNARVLISGDPIQDGSIFMFGPQRNMELYIKSLEALTARIGDFDEIWPSHASIPVKPALIPELIAGARAVLSGELAGKPMNLFGNDIHAFDAGCAVFLCE